MCACMCASRHSDANKWRSIAPNGMAPEARQEPYVDEEIAHSPEFSPDARYEGKHCQTT